MPYPDVANEPAAAGATAMRDPMTAPVGFPAAEGVSRIGLLLTLLLAALLLPVLWRDHESRISAAQQQATAHAVGVERLLFVQLRNIERALAGLAGDAAQLHSSMQGDPAAMLGQMAAAVDARHAELDGVLLVDGLGRARTPGRGDPRLPAWFATAPVMPGSALRIGAIERDDDGQWLLPMALRMHVAIDDPPGWALARLRVDALQEVLAGLPLGEQGIATVFGSDGVMYARSRDVDAYRGQRFTDLSFLPLIAEGHRDGFGEVRSKLDGVRRLRSFRALENYPFVAVVALARREVLAPWYPFAWLTAIGAAGYSLAWVLLLRRERRHGQRHATVLGQLAEVERQYHFVFERSPLSSWIFDRETLAFLEVNRSAVSAYGYTREEFLGMRIVDIRPPEDVAPLLDDLQSQAADGVSGPWRHRRRDGSIIHVMVHGSDIRFAGRPARLALVEDITERLRLEKLAEFRARHDELTGLPNRAAFTDALALHLQRVLVRQGRCAVAVLDFNQFQLINDNLGHAVGDAVLRVVGQRLQRLAPGAGHAARLGGDEFALCLEADDPAALQGVLDALSAPITSMGTVSYLTPNIGVADFPDHADTAQSLVMRASLAMHEAKRRPGGGILHFQPGFERASADRQQMIGRLHQAIQLEQFELHYQPQCRLGDARAVGVEVLLRWNDPQRGMVYPDAFIGLCESSGLIVPLGRWVLQETCRRRQQLIDAGWPALTMAVNVSSLQFGAGDFVADVEALVREFALPPGALELELTESVVMDNPEQTIERMQALRRLGMRLSIDDFGTGYSSMAYLRRLPVDKLKIDRSFVTDVERDPHNAAICEAILALARSFSMTVIAEGVETEDESRWLLLHGCSEAQGYLQSRPIAFDSLLTWLAQNDAGRA